MEKQEAVICAVKLGVSQEHMGYIIDVLQWWKNCARGVGRD